MLALLALDDTEAEDAVNQALELGFPQFQLNHTNSGKKCIYLAKTNHYDVIVLDSFCKDLDSYEVLRQIRTFSDVPILMLSYVHQESQLVKAFELGADDYMQKPVRSMEIVARIGKLLKHRRMDIEKSLNDK